MAIDDWERIIDALDDLEDVLFLEEYQADANEELLPAEMVYALLDGENRSGCGASTGE